MTQPDEFSRIVIPGYQGCTMPGHGPRDSSTPCTYQIRVQIQYLRRPEDNRPEPALSITGDLDELRRLTNEKPDPFMAFHPGWDRDLCRQLVDVTERWHLNDMRPGCEHQRALGWTSCPGHYSKNPELIKQIQQLEVEFTTTHNMKQDLDVLARYYPTGYMTTALYDKIQEREAQYGRGYGVRRDFPKLTSDEDGVTYQCGNRLITEMPCGQPDRVGQPCPTCGYEYGSAWLYEPVPADVLEFLRQLPQGGPG